MPVSRFAPGVFGAALVFGLAWFDGGFFAPAWGVATLGLLGVCGVALALADSLPFSGLALASLAGLFGLALWTLASGLWTSDLTKTVSDAELAFVYPIALVAALLVARRSGVSALALGTLAAMVAICAYALGGRLVPEVFGFPNDVDAAGRLYSPIGYWNGLGGFAAIAALLAAGLAAARLPAAVRAAAAASLVITLPTLYLTFSRGSLVAAMTGLVVLVAASPARLWLIATLAAAAPWAAASVLVVERRSALTATILHRQSVIDQGHGAVVWLVALAAGAAVSSLALTLLAARLHVGVRPRRAIGVVLLVTALLLAAAAVERRGGPVDLARSVRHSLESEPRGPTANNASHLRDLSLNGRLDQWRVALDMFRAHPVTGTGAGTWEAEWLRHEPSLDYNQRAHSLYLETLGELGAIGLGLLALALLPPLAAFLRTRNDPPSSAALAALAVFLTHAAVDWDWQLPAVTVPALLCAACLMGGALAGPGIAMGETMRWGLVGTTVALALCAAFTLQGNRLIADAADHAAQGESSAAIADANGARTWLPWSYLPDTWQGEAELAAGDRAAAAASFHNALGFDSGNWRLWFDVARVTTGTGQRRAIARARLLYPLSPELAAFCATRSNAQPC